MKVIAILEHSITGGGGFNQALNAIMQMQKICKGRFEFEVFSTEVENSPYLQKLGINSVTFSYSLMDKFLAKIGINLLWQALQSRIKIIGRFEKKLNEHNCDLVYFATPSGYIGALQKLNYIVTIWDNCHRDTPEFPEVRNFNQFFIRERNNRDYLAAAVAVIVDSKSLANSISFRYGIEHSRLLPMPFSPSPFLISDTIKSKQDVMIEYKLDEGYFFYPAQLWAHKNHLRILEALLLLNNSGKKHRVVFAGGDQGNQTYLEQFVKDNNLGDQVHFLGFVPIEDIHGLYEGCHAVIMPTYFGPTNLPPLEAWTIKKPLIYSMNFSEQTGDAAALVNPDDASDIASAISSCMNEDFYDKLIKAGLTRLKKLNDDREISEADLLARLERFEKKLSCWSINHKTKK